ncbi:hypothetical protein ElyMa_000551500 [Elysia marginata]|uniref:Uncharacterized protein n=1 Tax=Elysia marginata TaxID=1093978 RepID=A0AAV4G1Z3_9GAST|nr:hypothetical protein ElyMa_000551500 [Elysia marginata]
MERSLSRSLPYLPRYQSLSPARSPCLGGRRFASLRSVSSPSHSQRICYIDAGEPTKFVSTSYRVKGSPSPKRSYKVHLFGPAFSSDGKKRVHHATRVTRSISAHDLHSSHVYTSQDDLLLGAARPADVRRVCTSLQDLFHKGPFHPNATTASESGVSLGGLSDESLSMCGGDDLDNLSQHSFDSSSAFHEITFDSEQDRCDSSDAYFSGAEGNYSGSHQSGERLLDVLFEDDPECKSPGARRRRAKQSVSSPLSYSEHRRRELQFPSLGEQENKTQAKLQVLRVLIPGTDVQLRTCEATFTGVKDRSKSPGEKKVLSSTPLAQSTPHVSPRSLGEAKLSILATWDADDSMEEQQHVSKEGSPCRIARVLFDADSSELRDGSSCNSSQSEDNFSDISSTTVGSLTCGRRTKLVKRSSDKPASLKSLANLDNDLMGKKGPFGSNPLNSQQCENMTGIRGSSITATSRYKSNGCEDSPEVRLDDSGNDGGNRGPLPSAVSSTWQDRQTYHEGNARVTGTFGSLDEDEDEDDGEEADVEGDGKDAYYGYSSVQNRKKRPFNLVEPPMRVLDISLSPGSGGGGNDIKKSVESTGKVNMPLICAGKHGQEKLRKRLSQSSPPLSPGDQGDAPHESNLKSGLMSVICAGGTCISDDNWEGVGGKKQSRNTGKPEKQGEIICNSLQAQNEAELIIPENVKKRNLEEYEINDERKYVLEKKRQENFCEETRSAITAAEARSRSSAHVIIGDAQGDGFRTGESYDRHAGPGEVTGISEVTAGHSAYNPCQVEREGVVVVKIASKMQQEGRGEQPGTDSRSVRESGREQGREGPTISSPACLPEGREHREGEIKDESQVVLGAGERVGEVLRSRSTSPKLTIAYEEGDVWSSGGFSRGSEQSKSELRGDRGAKITAGISTIPVLATTERAENYCDSNKLVVGDANSARIESVADAWISPGGDRFKSELKLTLTVTSTLKDSVDNRADVERKPTGAKSSFSGLNSSQSINTDVRHEQENEKEKANPSFYSFSCDADSCVIGEARSSMERFPIDPAIVESARAASERETPQMLVRVLATAQNTSDRETVQQARHKDQSQQLSLKTEFPSQQPELTSQLPYSGFLDSKNSSHNNVNGLADHAVYSFSGDGLELNNYVVSVDTHIPTENKNEEYKNSNYIEFCEQEEKQPFQSLNGNIPRHANDRSIPEQISGCSLDENKGFQSLDNSASGCAHVEFTEDGRRVVQKKQVVTEVCHTVVKKTHSTTVEDNVSTERDFDGSVNQPCVSEIGRRTEDRSKDTSSKTTIVEDVEDTVTTKTTTTTTTLNLDSISSGQKNEETYVRTVNSNRSETSKHGRCFDSEKIESQQSRSFSPAGRDECLENCGDRNQIQLSTSGELTPPVSRQSDVPSTHVMREVKPDWEAQVDPRVTAWHSSSSPPSSSQKPHGNKDGGVNLHPVKRHGDSNQTTGSRLDNLQATLAQISGMEEKTGAWSCHRDVPKFTFTHGSPSFAAFPFSPSYQDHAEATSVLKQIVRGDTDGFPNFSRPGRPAKDTGYGDDYDTLPENSTQVHSKNSGPTYYSYSIEVREEPTRDNYTPGAEIKNGDLKVRPEREFYDNDYDNAPFITTALPSRHHPHHHLQLLKPGQLKASSLWTLQEETESLLEAVSPKPARRTLTSLASDDEDNASINDEDTEKKEPTENDDTRPSPEVGRSNQSISSVEQDLSDTAIGHKNCVSESSDFDDSDGNYSSISTGESASYRSSSYGREQTPMSDEPECVVNKMEYRPAWRGLTATNIDGVSTFSDFVSGLEESLSSPCTDTANQKGNLKRRREQSERVFTLDSLSESLRQFSTPQHSHAEFGPETFPGRNSPIHIFRGVEMEHQRFHSLDNGNFHFSRNHQTHDQLSHPARGSRNTSAASTSILSHYSMAMESPEDAPSEASMRLHTLDLDLSRISSCGSPVPSDLSEASSAYTCTGTAQIKRHQLHVSFGDAPTASALPSPPTRDVVHTSTPKAKSKTVSIIKRPSPLREDLKFKQKLVHDNLQQFDQILQDFQKRTHPTEAINDIEIMETQETNVLADKTSDANVSNYADLYKDFTNDTAEKKQNNTCIVLEDENMNSYRFKRYLKKSHTKRKKGKKVMRFFSRLSCVSEGVSAPDMSPANKKLKTDNGHQNKHNVQTFSTDSMPSASSSSRLMFPNPQLTGSTSFQHHSEIEARLGVSPSSPDTPPQGSPASSTQSVDSVRSRADSAYSSISESISHGSVSSPRHLLHSIRGSTSSDFQPRASTVSTSDRSFSTDSAYSGSDRTASEVDRTLVDFSKENSGDMLSALSDVFEQLDVCEGEIDKALLDRMRHGHYRAARPTRRM